MNNHSNTIRRQLRLAALNLVFLLACAPFCFAEDTNDTAGEKDPQQPELQRAALDYYMTQSAITDPGTESNLFDDLPTDVEDVVKMLQGLIIHAGNLEDSRIKPSKEQNGGYDILRCEDLLRRIRRLDGRPFAVRRDIEHRLVVICREYAVLMCSMLRHRNVPARVRAGYATYLADGKFVQHYVCEYWGSEEQRWILVEPDYDQSDKHSIGFNPLDMPKGKFLVAGQGWKLCRTGKTDLKLFGLGEEGMGWSMVLPTVFADFMALNKLELHPWDTSPLGEKDYEKLTEEELSLIDRIADYTISVDKHFAEMRELYDTNATLKKQIGNKP